MSAAANLLSSPPHGMSTGLPAPIGLTSEAETEGYGAVNMPWYVVHTKARQEQVAADNLSRQGFAVYLPMSRVFKRVRSRLQLQREPLFARYLFVRPRSPAMSLSPVRSTLGVSALVRFGLQPALMRDAVLASIRQFEARRNAAIEEQGSPFQAGARVCIADGPLAGLEGLVSDVARERVGVLLELLGRETRVNLSPHQLQQVA